jgi:tetratricopeptide (TPR) repeat protein
MRVLTTLCITCVLSAPVFGQTSPAKAAEARRHFENGTRLYANGQMVDALSEFEQAQALKPDPALLYDLAQTHRSLGHDATALTFYRAFLEQAPYTPNREEVQGKIKIIEEELSRREAEHKKLESTVAAAEARRHEAEEAKRAADELQHVAALQKQQAEEAQRVAREAQEKVSKILEQHDKPTPIYKKWWLWTIVGGVAVAGVVTTAVLASPKTPATNQGGFAF